MKITVGIPQKDCDDAASLYWEAFGDKLGFSLGPKYRAIRFIRSVMRPDHGVCAHDENGRLIGVAGFKTSEGALVGGEFRDLRRVYGWVGASIRTALLAALERDTENERFLMDGLFVAKEARGQGVGTALLDAIAAEAKRRGYRQIRLDVVDTNARAKSLYLQEGFRELKTDKIGLLRYAYGFNAATSMVRDLYPEPMSAPAAKTSAPPKTT